MYLNLKGKNVEFMTDFLKPLLAALVNSFDVTATGNFFFISGYFSNVKDASRLFGAGVIFYLFEN